MKKPNLFLFAIILLSSTAHAEPSQYTAVRIAINEFKECVRTAYTEAKGANGTFQDDFEKNCKPMALNLKYNSYFHGTPASELSDERRAASDVLIKKLTGEAIVEASQILVE